MQGLLWLLGPTLWIWALLTFGSRFWRLKHERRLFGSAINANWLDLAANLIGGLVAALAVSGLAFAIGLVLPSAYFIVLGGTFILAALLTPWRFSLAWLGLAPGIYWILGRLDVLPMYNVKWVPAAIVLLGLLWLANGLLLRFLNPPIDMPRIQPWRRGTNIVTYTRRQWYFLPLILPIRGTTFLGLSWWPTLHFGATSFALIGLPLFLGIALTTRKSLPTVVIDRWSWQYDILGLAMIVVGGFSAWLPNFVIAEVIAIGLIAPLLLILQGQAVNRGTEFFVQPSDGVRVIGVQPETPAAKMGLSAGDVILLVNGQAVTDESGFYEALQAHPTYARLKVRRSDGELVMTETAIHNDAPYEIGLKLFAEEMS